MGGNLFRFPRMPRDRYIVVDARVRAALREHMGTEGVDWAVPRWYGDKADFGDMDVLLASSQGWLDRRDALVQALSLRRPGDPEIVAEPRRAGNVLSLPVCGLQVDFFSFAPDELQSAWSFMCFNDIGNLVGRIARGFNAKFGDTGLSYVWRSADGACTHDVLLTRDFSRVCAFLDLDHAVWLRGFQARVDMFEWVTGSRYFSVAPYLDDTPTRSHVLRRNRGRTTITAFGTWLVETRQVARPALPDRRSPEHVVALDRAFPEADLPGALGRLQAAEDRAHLLHERFSGHRVMALCPELLGRELGEFMAGFRRARPDFDEWLLMTDQADIDAAIMQACVLSA